MSRGVAVAAYDCHPRLSEAKFRPNDVHNPLFAAFHIKERDAKLNTVIPQGLHLVARNRRTALHDDQPW